MAQIRNFMDLVVWQKAHRLFLEVVKDVEAFPSGLPGRVVADQLLRSSGSISANISEGFGRRKGKEYVHYLIVARGSTTETLNWLLKARDLEWLKGDTFDSRESLIVEILRMLNAMIAQKQQT